LLLQTSALTAGGSLFSSLFSHLVLD